MKQTAVEWYEKEVNSLIEKYEPKEISEREFITMKHNLFYPAKKMEREQQGYSKEEVKRLAFKFYLEMSKQMKVPDNLITENYTNVDELFDKINPIKNK